MIYQELANMACERISAAITRASLDERPIKVLLDPYNPVGSTRHVSFNSSKKTRYETDSRKSHINWVMCDSDWEAEFCRIAEKHPQVISYVKNQGLGLEVPYLLGSEPRKYLPDFIVQVDDGQSIDGQLDPLNLIVEVKGYRGEDAKDKKNTMDVYWIPGVDNLGTFGRWAFAEFTEVYAMQSDFKEKLKREFGSLIDTARSESAAEAAV